MAQLVAYRTEHFTLSIPTGSSGAGLLCSGALQHPVLAGLVGILGGLSSVLFRYLLGILSFAITGQRGGMVAVFSSLPPWQKTADASYRGHCFGADHTYRRQTGIEPDKHHRLHGGGGTGGWLSLVSLKPYQNFILNVLHRFRGLHRPRGSHGSAVVPGRSGPPLVDLPASADPGMRSGGGNRLGL